MAHLHKFWLFLHFQNQQGGNTITDNVSIYQGYMIIPPCTSSSYMIAFLSTKREIWKQTKNKVVVSYTKNNIMNNVKEQHMVKGGH